MVAVEKTKSLAKLAKEINREHEACEASEKSAVQHAIAAGNLLIQAKRMVEHGEWLIWLQDNFKGNPRTAARYMKLAEAEQDSESNSTCVSNLESINSALRYLAGDDEPDSEDGDAPEADTTPSEPAEPEEPSFTLQFLEVTDRLRDAARRVMARAPQDSSKAVGKFLIRLGNEIVETGGVA